MLVTAGSNGALVFNETMPLIAARLLAEVPGLTIVHQSGPRALEATRAAYAASGADTARWRVEAFLTDMPAQYAAADVVLARAGSTVAELCAAGKPSLLVPFAGAADDHQRKNAEVLVEAGAAEMLLQRDVTRGDAAGGAGWIADRCFAAGGDGGEGAAVGAAGSAAADCGDGAAAGGAVEFVGEERGRAEELLLSP